ncbi:hypothetical protein EHQ53_03490 [Leptospira langatensis]|uniref:Lipoprotein n=1 Tax=Leptospira langatensis TaxID=2484983 RepID=A0A5F1ZXW4_9LEPT|nr:hypothetical protein [Leptospira langatensis]TGK04225.1 hypothetical protein EHO57_03720 [Leptospira langatensis]TGL43705.1 hypothetical protein EHQ53_03490 [Leptospira langatensis]
MDSHSKKTIGFVLALGFALQVACSSIASLTGSCPVTMESAISVQTEKLPPCHKTSEKSDEKNSSDPQKDCCGKDAPVSVSVNDSWQSVDAQKLKIEKIVLHSFLPQTSVSLSFRESVVPKSRQIRNISRPQALSLLQTFLI